MNLETLRHPVSRKAFVAFAMVALLIPGSVPLQGGDILRGGAPMGSPAQRANAATRSTAAAAAAARANARDNLARTTRAIQSVQAFQNAARQAATGNNAGMNPNAPGTALPNVPNGLGAGGLEVDPGVALNTAVWAGADLPTETSSGNRTTVNIRQTRQTALLSWRTFNVGRNTTLRYNQSAAGPDVNKWVAFNKINDPGNAPSQILGSIEAPGQVYVINRNGIIFGAGSQVNVGTLVASSLPINDNLIAQGLLNNPDAQFLFSGIAIPAGAQGTPAFTPDPVNPAIGRYGDVIVQPGATITSPTNAAKSGGRVMLVGPNVRQAGSISTPDGQTILAAGMQVGINAHSSDDPSLRGLDVYVGSVDPGGGAPLVGEVEQSGIVSAARGNITLAGREIRQNGTLASSTSVSLNGRIDILASYDAISNTAFNPSNTTSGAPFLNRATGVVRFGAGSVVRVLPEIASDETVIGRELALASQINVVGRTVHVGRNASIQAPSGDIRINAGEWRIQGLGGTSPVARFIQSVGQVYVDANALIDVAGSTDIPVSILQQILTLELRGSELANSPLQRDSLLRESSVTVDSRNSGTYNGLDWIGTPLADATGYAGLIQRTVGEFTAPGGSIQISAGESVVLREGSKLDASGGFLQYKGAKVETTRLILGNRLVDIKDATPNRLYDGIYTGRTAEVSERWGVTNVYDQPLAIKGERVERGYIEGAAGGSIDITAPGMVLDGTLLGRTVEGPRQRAARENLSSLHLAFRAQDTSYPSFPDYAPTPPSVVFRNDSNLRPADAFTVDALGNAPALRADRLATVGLSPELLTEGGFGNLDVENPDGNVTVPKNIALTTAPGGSVSFEGSNITINGGITARGGTLTFAANNLSLADFNDADFNRVRPSASPGRGSFVLGAGAFLDASGLLVDDRATGNNYLPTEIQGGGVSISGYDVRLGNGSIVDVSGGAQLSTRGRVTYGNGGVLSINAGRDLRVGEVFGGGLYLGGSLRGYSGATGGTMNLSALAFQIGGNSAPAGVSRLNPEFFSRGGFAAFNLRGMGLPGADPIAGIRVMPGTRVRPIADSLLAVPNPVEGSGARLVQITRPEGLRSPVSLSFTATGATDSFNSGFPIVRGDLVVGAGSAIITDGLGRVTLRGETTTVLGRVVAPGGAITVGGASSYPLSGEALATVYIGSNAVLSTAGKAIIREGLNGYREGTVLAGGTVSISGNIVAEQGSLINVAGASGVLDQPASYRGVNEEPIVGLLGQEYVPVRYSTNGGTINLTGAQMLYSDATLHGPGGGRAATGGTLNVSSGRFISPGTPFTTAEANLVVTQSGNSLPANGLPRGIGLGVRTAGGAALPGIGNFVADDFRTSGLASLSLGGNVRFKGAVAIDADASLRVASGGVIYADNAVNLSAAYANLGQAFRVPALANDQIILYTQTDANGVTTPYQFAPTNGNGTITVRADLIDVGTLSLQNVGSINLIAARGDVRGNGTLQVAGDVFIRAGQVYPTTLRSFNIFAYDHAGGTGSVTFAGGSNRETPLSAGGHLAVHATDIVQNGTLRAPIGTITLGWDGTGDAPINEIAGGSIATPVTDQLTLGTNSNTSVSALGARSGRGIVIPYGISFDGESWIDPAGNDITVGGVPAKTVNLSGASVTTPSGSVIDIRGGGDLYAYRWISGNGGTRDILASENTFAVIPGYAFDYAPYAPFNSGAEVLQGETGYVNGTLKPGDQVTLGASDALPAGTYTLLPARYALLPGAVLVTPVSGAPVGTKNLDDGSSIVSGYRANSLDPGRAGRTSMQRFEVATAEVFRERAEYADFRANSFLRKAAVTRGFDAPRLPVDSGYLAFNATAAMAVAGRVLSEAPAAGRGALVDIASPTDIYIIADGGRVRPNVLTLSASLINSFSAESLLVGGRRTFQNGAYSVEVTTNNLTIENEGTPLVGSDLVFVANRNLGIDEGSVIIGNGNNPVEALSLGDADVVGSGDGALLRVSGSRNAPVTRSGVSSSTVPALNIDEGVLIRGGSATLDSTYATGFDPDANLVVPVLALNSGQVSLRLQNPGGLNPTDGLVLGADTLDKILTNTSNLSLLSYTSLDLYGNGSIGSANLDSLSLRASAIRGFNQGGGTFAFAASNLLLENTTGRSITALPAAPLNGTLEFNADQITLGSNSLSIERFADTRLMASSRVLVSGEGAFAAGGDIEIASPMTTGAAAARHSITAGGDLRFVRPVGATSGSAGGLGALVELNGESVSVDSDIVFNSGEITLSARSGDLVIGASAPARIDTTGISRNFLDVVRHTGGGTVTLGSSGGDVRLAALGIVDVSAPTGGGDAGFLNVSAPTGSFSLDGAILGRGGNEGRSGSFSLDAATISGNDLAGVDADLNGGFFNESRNFRIRTGNLAISGSALSREYRVFVDSGSLNVAGTIDASGTTGGTIDLSAHQHLVLAPTAILDASGDEFSAAGKGGAIHLGAGATRDGVINAVGSLDIRTGSRIDLGVAAANAGSARLGQFEGTLHLRAPQTAGFTDVRIDPIGGTIDGASAIFVEGYRVYDLTGSGLLTNPLLTNIRNDGNAFLGTAGTASANHTAMQARLTSLQPGLDLILGVGAEILNRTGNLVLGSTSSTASSDWNLSTLRFGPDSAPGVLTLRAANNIELFNAISDGFSGGSSLWLSPLMARNPNLPANMQSWSYRFSAGADFRSADTRAVRPLDELAANAGSIRIGKNAGSATAGAGGPTSLTSNVIANRFQVVRTGSGDIDINAGRNVQLLNPFVSIYTAGTQVEDPTGIHAANDFVTPILSFNLSQGSLGVPQQTYFAQYSMAGGNVTIRAGQNIERKTQNGTIDDSSRQLPNNWLYRRGYVGSDGTFGTVTMGTGFNTFVDPAASTSWWVDFSNFFQSVGALGGGNVTMIAGNEVRNVDAVIPTNARAPRGVPDASLLQELGGGDLLVRSGGDISGGVYYVERGVGRLEAGGSVTTNAARSPSLGVIQSLSDPASAQLDSNTWMPTTLFLGKSSFEVSARGDVLLGPAANPFLLPQGLNNQFWYKTYFSTFDQNTSVDIVSLGGDVTLRNAITFPDSASPIDVLTAWMTSQNLLATAAAGAAWQQPWLRLAETSLAPFSAIAPIRPPGMTATALDGDIHLAGNITLFPSPTGHLELVASGSIDGFQPTGLSNLLITGQRVQAWGASGINVSDADPDALPSAIAPFNYYSRVGSSVNANNGTQSGFFDPVARYFTDSFSTTGSFGLATTKQALHDSGLLHRNDPDPLRVYALGGDLSGFSLFSPKRSLIHASRDITDISFYLQNLSSSDSTIVSAGRDIIPSNSSSLLRNASFADGNFPASGESPLPGDIHLGGPGTLQVLAGRNLDLGLGSTNADGSGSGILTIGNTRNPGLPFDGADLIAAAGLGDATSLGDSDLRIDAFINRYIDTAEGRRYLAELGVTNFNSLGDEERASIALKVFYLVLRDAGRDFNNEKSPDFGTYREGFAAIETLFGDGRYDGDILSRSRNIRTQNGGDISLIAPGGSLTLANTTIGNPLTPPGIVTESGGRVSIFTDRSVDIGIGRIFTLRGGDMVIWSSRGDIAAGVASKTVASAPPTRVLIDPQSGAVQTDLAGLATGGGIGVLATVAGVRPGNVDLIAPAGIIDAGDAGIRVTGDINLAATQVVNASNIAAGGSSSGAPSTPSASSPSVGGLTAGASSTAAASTAALDATDSAAGQAATTDAVPEEVTLSVITVEVLGYGGGPVEEEDEENAQ